MAIRERRLLRDRVADALRATADYLSPPRDPVMEALDNAPLDDEPLTEADRQAIEEARLEFERGEWFTDAQIRREFG